MIAEDLNLNRRRSTITIFCKEDEKDLIKLQNKFFQEDLEVRTDQGSKKTERLMRK